jgi:2-octaprenyl-6-methoxyphenol hydroxylase
MLPSSNITIVGCGLSGMISALAFASRGIKSTIIEKQAVLNAVSQSFSGDTRTVALTDATRKFFKEINIWSSIFSYTGIISDIYVVDHKSSEMLHFKPSGIESSDIIGYLIKNSDLRNMLLSLVIANDLIDIIDNCCYEIKENNLDNCVLSLSNGKEHITDLLLVCDGRNSLARQKFFSSNIEKNYNQSALTFIVSHDKSHEGTAVEHFIPSGPFAILPLKDQNFSSIVWTVASNMRKPLENLPPEEFLEIVQSNFGDFLGKVKIESNIESFSLKAYHTNKYFNKRMVLIADTAHIIHPLAGQGLNQGIKDINCLLDLVIQYGITDTMLNNYQNLRKTDNSIMLEITDNINQVFSNNSRILKIGRSLAFKAIEKFPAFKKFLIKYGMGER